MSLLPTILIRILHHSGSPTQKLRSLLDTGSQINLITNDAIQRLGLRIVLHKVDIAGLGDVATMLGSGYVDIDIMHHIQPGPFIRTRLIVVPKITKCIPSKRLRNLFKDEIKATELADPYYYIPGNVDVLFGATMWAEISKGRQIVKNIDNSSYIAQATSLGWVIIGGNNQYSNINSTVLHIAASVKESSENELNDLLQRFWKIETIPEKPMFTKNEIWVESNFMETHKRGIDGRYVVDIPFNKDAPPLGKSRHIALNRMLNLEKKLASSPELQAEYCKFMMDYINLGHMILAPPPPENPSESYYIPYHAITKKKFRIVFDASCSSSNGISLNDRQFPGPKLQDDLCKIFLRFRIHRYVVKADIVKMFRQVGINPQQWNYQRILWRPTTQEPIREYQITVIVWGMTSATYNAVRALRQCATDHLVSHPIAARAALNDFYVDDFLSGTDSTKTLLNLYKQLSEMLKAGGFELSKWSTNNPILAKLYNHDPIAEVNITSEAGILGMSWSPHNDNIHLKYVPIETITDRRPTKADIISAISKVYDPSGLFGPTIVLGKLIMQDFWREPHIGWKDIAPEHLIKRWQEFNSELEMLTSIAVPRWVQHSPKHESEWHVFTDASEKAYGAAVYIRTYRKDSVCVTLLTSKSRVAPIKTQTIPRLELFGALLGTKLLQYVKSATGLDNLPEFYWTDSTIVLHWLRKEPSSMSSFIGTRITQITDVSSPAAWRHVKSVDNPADSLSRGVSGSQLKDLKLWWEGPTWLKESIKAWPNSTIPLLTLADEQADSKESKKNRHSANTPVVFITTAEDITADNSSLLQRDNFFLIKLDDGKMQSLLERRPNMNSLLRVTAYVFKYINALKRRIKATSKNKLLISRCLPESVSALEKDHARLIWIRIAQTESFRKEIQMIKNSQQLPNNSKLKRLAPRWYNEERLIRLTGRLEYSTLTNDQKHPIILDAKHPFTVFLIQEAHLRTLHGGTQLCITYLRQQYWIIGLRRAIKSYIFSKCVTCIRHRQQTADQFMGQLPAARVTPAEPFSCVGIDFAGPFSLRKTAATTISLRKLGATNTNARAPTVIKGWIVVYICMITRAVHLDLVKSLTVETFLECFARFVSRRGQCSEIWSDNGTTFVGSNNELIRVFKEWGEIPHAQLSNLGTTWKFITPGAPHRGGIWEAAVKSLKHHLYRVVGQRILTSDQMYTLLTQIEACMNARPLFAQTDDPLDLSPITPAHLVIGRSTLQRPLTEDVTSRPDNRLTMWGLQQKILQQFWQIWREDYLSNLQLRNKWYNIEKNLKVGDMVLIKNENTPPSIWPLGRVEETFSGTDGLVRTARIRVAITKDGKTTTTTYERPVQKLCILLHE